MPSVAAIPNPWFSSDFVSEYSDKITSYLLQHISLTVSSVLIALVVAFPIAVIAHRFRWIGAVALGTAGVIYTIPSLALFGLLLPYTGITETTVLIALTLYNLLVLIRNTLIGFGQVPPETIEAARGMGIGRGRMLFRIELPLALPSIMAGIRVATVSTIALVTVGSIVGNGGLGQMMYESLQRTPIYRAELMTATVLCLLLALVADLLLVGIGWAITPWRRSTR